MALMRTTWLTPSAGRAHSKEVARTLAMREAVSQLEPPCRSSYMSLSRSGISAHRSVAVTPLREDTKPATSEGGAALPSTVYAASAKAVVKPPSAAATCTRYGPGATSASSQKCVWRRSSALQLPSDRRQRTTYATAPGRCVHRALSCTLTPPLVVL